MKYLSLFSGIEAATVAWKPLGWECVAVAEILPYQSSVIAKHFPEIKNFGDVTKITEEDIKTLGKFDVVIFGSPCQDMSVAGNRMGLEAEKENSNHSSILFFEGMRVFRLAQEHCGEILSVWRVLWLYYYEIILTTRKKK
jgi:DNA (cytosine-5)-methyltransferase 1